MLVTCKERPSQLAKTLRRVRDLVALRRRQLWIGTFGSAVAVFGVLFIGLALTSSAHMVLEDMLILSGVLGTFGLVGVVILHIARARSVHMKGEKLTFAEEFLEAFWDDMHPAGKVHQHLDMRDSDLVEKRVWSGRSAHGNPKYRYRDRWFRAKFFLADGTEVVVERRIDQKVRKGALIKTKRHVDVKVYPNERTFGRPFAGGDMEQLVRRAVRSAFGNRPEGLTVQLQGKAVAVRATQLDTTIAADEVRALVEAVLLTLRMR